MWFFMCTVLVFVCSLVCTVLMFGSASSSMPIALFIVTKVKHAHRFYLFIASSSLLWSNAIETLASYVTHTHTNTCHKHTLSLSLSLSLSYTHTHTHTNTHAHTPRYTLQVAARVAGMNPSWAPGVADPSKEKRSMMTQIATYTFTTTTQARRVPNHAS